ncbi:MAG: helix-turn-helix domain-containing protein [Nitrososphaerota archaeon]|jgi:predicted transcriptional regulator|nr:helix-turn-helix domain-containing protein [Nitrososphaerota archaeon]
MSPQCEIIAKYILPIFRSMLAKELVQTHHLSQTETAKKLGTTQAAISQYLNSKRAYKGTKQIEEFLPQIQTLATETAKKIADNKTNPENITPHICNLCTTLYKKTTTPQTSKPKTHL